MGGGALSLAAIVTDGPLVAAAGISVAAGLASFLSPCVLPLVPGYLSYVTGMAGADLDRAMGVDPRGRPVDPNGPDDITGTGAKSDGDRFDKPRTGGDGARTTAQSELSAVPDGIHPDGASAEGAVATDVANAEGSRSGDVNANASDSAVVLGAGAPDLAAGVAARRRRVRGRVLAGSLLFVAGFTAVFTILSVAAGSFGYVLLDQAPLVQRVVGGLMVLMGLVFLGVVPGFDRTVRLRWQPASGLAGAPLLGAVFALGWLPCTGPTLAAVLGMAATQGTAGRGAVLAAAYCVGIGIPFVAFGLGFRWLLGALAVVRRHSRWITAIGGGMLILVGVLLVIGAWDPFVIWLRAWLPPGEIPF